MSNIEDMTSEELVEYIMENLRGPLHFQDPSGMLDLNDQTLLEYLDALCFKKHGKDFLVGVHLIYVEEPLHTHASRMVRLSGTIGMATEITTQGRTP